MDALARSSETPEDTTLISAVLSTGIVNVQASSCIKYENLTQIRLPAVIGQFNADVETKYSDVRESLLTAIRCLEPRSDRRTGRVIDEGDVSKTASSRVGSIVGCALDEKWNVES